MSLLLTLALLAAPSLDATQALLKEKACRTTPIAGGVRLECAKAWGLVTISVQDLQGDLKLLSETTLKGIRASMKANLSMAAGTLKADGKTWAGTRLEVRAKEGMPIRLKGLHVATQLPATVRQVTCLEAKPGPCQALMPALILHGPSPFAPAPLPLHFLGKALATPPGCVLAQSSEAGVQLNCPGAEMSWSRLEAKKDLVPFRKMILPQLMKVVGTKERREAPCTIGGVATQCAVLENAATRYYAGTALLGEAAIFALCGTPKGQAKPHPACAGVLAY